jgi:hypothetical protein
MFRPAAFAGGLLCFAVFSVLSVFVAGCTKTTASSPWQDTVTGPLHGTVTTDPPPRADGSVPRDARFIVQLDGYPDPDTAVYGSLTLHSGTLSFDFSIDFDFVAQQVIMTPHSLLAAGAQYNVVAINLGSVDGRVMSQAALGSARAGDDVAGRPPAPPAPTWSGDVQRVLGGCAPYCHSPVGASGRMRTPTRLLDLTGDPFDRTYGLVGVMSVGQTDTLQPMLRVAAGDPARSELLRKLLGGSPSADSLDPPYPNMGVDGRRMPIPLDEGLPATSTLSNENLRLVQAWIAGGALP